MRFIRRASVVPQRLGILAGSFNPPTCAHVGLIEAAARLVDEVVCVVPRVFPHKLFHGATLEDRLHMLDAISPTGIPYSVAVVERGLFIDIARDCRSEYGPRVDLAFLCGRDAAERFFEWDYGHPEAALRMLDEFRLLVAARRGQYEPPPELAHRIAALEVAQELTEISSTDVRERIRKGEPWEHLVPESIRQAAQRIYR